MHDRCSTNQGCRRWHVWSQNHFKKTCVGCLLEAVDGVVGESRRKFTKSRRKFGKSRRSPNCYFLKKTEENKSQLQFGLDLTTKNTSNLFFLHHLTFSMILASETQSRSQQHALELIGYDQILGTPDIGQAFCQPSIFPMVRLTHLLDQLGQWYFHINLSYHWTLKLAGLKKASNNKNV